MIDWDLTPVVTPAVPSVLVFPAPYDTIIYNAATVTGNTYSATYVAPPQGLAMTYGAASLATDPFGSNIAFWWKPVSGINSAHILEILKPDLSAALTISVTAPGTLTAQTQNFLGPIDTDFQPGDTVLVQVSSTNEVSIKTRSVATSFVIDTITIPTGSSVIVLSALDNSVHTSISGELGASDLGSGLVPDNGFLPIGSLSSIIPPSAHNLDVLKVTVAGSYNGVSYLVNEAATVVDAANRVVAPMARGTIVEPHPFGLFFVNVGPNETYTSLATLSADLIRNGIFPKYLYIVYRGTTIEDSIDLTFPGIEGVTLVTDSDLGNVVTNTNAYITVVGSPYGILLEGEWHIHQLTARNLRLGQTTKIYASNIDIINLDCVSGSAELHVTNASNPAVSITNFHVFAPYNQEQEVTCKIYCHTGTQYGTVNLHGYSKIGDLNLYGCYAVADGGNHVINQITYNHISDTFTNPSSVLTVSHMAQCNVGTVAVPDPNNWGQIAVGLALSKGTINAPVVTGNVGIALSRTASSEMSAHTSATDPHGDRSYAMSVATDAEVAAKNYADLLVASAMQLCGGHDASSTAWPTTGGTGTAGAIKSGNLWFVSVPGTLGGKPVIIGDALFAVVDAPGQTDANWCVLDTNLGVVPETAGAASAAIAAHLLVTDPHGDRAFSIQRSNHSGTQTASTISDFSSAVTSSLLTGLAAGSNTPILATDNVLAALANLQAQISAGSTPVRATVTKATATIAVGVVESGVVSMAESYRVTKIATDRPARVRLYATIAQRDADASRAIGTAPSGNHGLLMEVITGTGALTMILTPQVDGTNFEASPSSNIPCCITNLDSATSAVTVTLTYIRTE